MIYFGVATLHFYRDSLTEFKTGTTLGDWAKVNQSVMDKVFKEAVEYFGYELSHSQMGQIVGCYLMKANVSDDLLTALPGA